METRPAVGLGLGERRSAAGGCWFGVGGNRGDKRLGWGKRFGFGPPSFPLLGFGGFSIWFERNIPDSAGAASREIFREHGREMGIGTSG